MMAAVGFCLLLFGSHLSIMLSFFGGFALAAANWGTHFPPPSCFPHVARLGGYAVVLAARIAVVVLVVRATGYIGPVENMALPAGVAGTLTAYVVSVLRGRRASAGP
jgi:hypothetical protein